VFLECQCRFHAAKHLSSHTLMSSHTLISVQQRCSVTLQDEEMVVRCKTGQRSDIIRQDDKQNNTREDVSGYRTHLYCN
jgi:hypothetical protein